MNPLRSHLELVPLDLHCCISAAFCIQTPIFILAWLKLGSITIACEHAEGKTLSPWWTLPWLRACLHWDFGTGSQHLLAASKWPKIVIVSGTLEKSYPILVEVLPECVQWTFSDMLGPRTIKQFFAEPFLFKIKTRLPLGEPHFWVSMGGLAETSWTLLHRGHSSLTQNDASCRDGTVWPFGLIKHAVCLMKHVQTWTMQTCKSHVMSNNHAL